MSFGRLSEDFFPLSSGLALVTTGRQLNSLDSIGEVHYKVEDGVVVFLSEPRQILRVNGVRLGGRFDGKLVYSCSEGIVGAEVESKTAHQPFVRDAVYYTDDWPEVKIYRDGEVFIDHFNDMVQVGNPCWIHDSLYFEARNTRHPQRADKWEIWRLRKEKLEFVCIGANPAGLDNQLFWGEWNGRDFDYYCTDVD